MLNKLKEHDREENAPCPVRVPKAVTKGEWQRQWEDILRGTKMG